MDITSGLLDSAAPKSPSVPAMFISFFKFQLSKVFLSSATAGLRYI